MLNNEVLMRMIIQERQREIAELVRAQRARPARDRAAAGRVRRRIGGMFIRLGVWLTPAGSPDLVSR